MSSSFDFGLTFPTLSRATSSQRTCIKVITPKTKQAGDGKYTVYTIKGRDQQGEFDVERRYSDFVKLREILTIQFPGCILPKLPTKQGPIDTFSDYIIEGRRIMLDLFCEKIAEIPYIHYYQGYQGFLRSKDQSVSLDSVMEPYRKVDYREMADRYNTIFGHLDRKGNNAEEAGHKMTEFVGFLDQVQDQMKHFKKNLGRNKISFYQEYSALNKKITNEFEVNRRTRSILLESTTDLEARGRTVHRTRKSSLKRIRKHILTEKIEFSPILSVMEHKNDYEKIKDKLISDQGETTERLGRLKAGKFSFKSMFSSKSREEFTKEYEHRATKNYADIEALHTINKLVTLVVDNEIQKFKMDQIYPYLNVLRSAAKLEIALNNKKSSCDRERGSSGVSDSSTSVDLNE